MRLPCMLSSLAFHLLTLIKSELGFCLFSQFQVYHVLKLSCEPSSLMTIKWTGLRSQRKRLQGIRVNLLRVFKLPAIQFSIILPTNLPTNDQTSYDHTSYDQTSYDQIAHQTAHQTVHLTAQTVPNSNCILHQFVFHQTVAILIFNSLLIQTNIILASCACFLMH